MHVHTTLVTLHDPAEADRCAALMETMRGRIDGLVDLQVHRNELAGNYSADIALTTVWRDVEAYRGYEHDPAHLEVRSVVLELMSDAATIDYSTEDWPS